MSKYVYIFIKTTCFSGRKIKMSGDSITSPTLATGDIMAPPKYMQMGGGGENKNIDK